jgi:tight adherence protein C
MFGEATAYIIVLLTFAGVSSLVYAISRYYTGYLIRRRLTEVTDHRKAKRQASLDIQSAPDQKPSALVQSLSKLSLPEDGWQNSDLRLRFIRAGFRDRTIAQMYFAIKTAMAFGFPVIVAAALFLFSPGTSPSEVLMYALICMAIGYFIPDTVLKYRTLARSEEIQKALPDLMDLLVVCIEAGLGLEAALTRVSRDIGRTSPKLAEELFLTTLEIRAGAGRIDALKNMALRVNLEDLDGLIAMLVQSDKFGTSLADALRIHSDNTRVRRTQRAEEYAAKIPVKILFPLICFIFPSLMIVLGGPAVIRLMQAL